MSAAPDVPPLPLQPGSHPQAQPNLQETRFQLGSVNLNALTRDILTPEIMEMIMARAREAILANNPQPNAILPPGNQNEQQPDHASNNVQTVRRVFCRQSRFVTFPLEIHLKICEWLSVRDILSLRMTSRHMNRVTHNGTLWLSAMKRLSLVLPSLPPTSRHLYGEIKPFMAEYLVTRSIHLHENFVFRPLTGSLVHQETYDQVLEVRILPGARFIVTLSQDCHGGVYVSLWEMKLYKGGARTPLVKTNVNRKPELFEAAYGTFNNELHVFLTFTSPPIQNETTLQFITKVSVVAIALELLEELADQNHSKVSFDAMKTECPTPLKVVYETSVTQKVQQIAMCDVQHTTLPNTLMIALVCRPRLLMFDYPELRSRNLYSGPASFISLGTTDIVIPTLPSTIWKIKLLPWQNCVLVSQLVVGVDGRDLRTFGLTLFRLPDVGKSLRKPANLGSQYLHGISVTGVYFSNLEEGWFSALRNPDKMLDSQFHSAPAPISIYVSVKGPNGLLHVMMHPTALVDEVVPVRGGKGHVTRYRYDFPFQIVKRPRWKWDKAAFCDILPGAFFSFAFMRSPTSAALDKFGLGVTKAISRVVGYKFIPGQYKLASITNTGAYTRHHMGYVQEESDCFHAWDCPDRCPFVVVPGTDVGTTFRRRHVTDSPARSLNVDASFWADMKKGVVAIAFDESTGVVCYSVDQDTRLRFVDFGGRFDEEICTTPRPSEPNSENGAFDEHSSEDEAYDPTEYTNAAIVV